MTIREDGSLALPTEISKFENERINNLGVCYSSETPEHVIYGIAANLADMVARTTLDSSPEYIFEIVTRGIEMIRAYGENPAEILAAQEAQNRSRYWWVGQHLEGIKSHPLGRIVLSKYAKEAVGLSNITSRMYLDPGMHEIEIKTLGELIESRKQWHDMFGYEFQREEIIELMKLELIELFQAINDDEKDLIDMCLEVADIVLLSASLWGIDGRGDGRDVYGLSPQSIEKLLSMYAEGIFGFVELEDADPMRSIDHSIGQSFHDRGIVELDPQLEYKTQFVGHYIERELAVFHNGVFVVERLYDLDGTLMAIAGVDLSDLSVRIDVESSELTLEGGAEWALSDRDVLQHSGSFALEALRKVPFRGLLK